MVDDAVQEDAPAKSIEASDTDKPAEVPDSDPTDREMNDENGEASSKTVGDGERVEKIHETEDDGGHVVEGEEDTVIY